MSQTSKVNKFVFFMVFLFEHLILVCMFAHKREEGGMLIDHGISTLLN